MRIKFNCDVFSLLSRMPEEISSRKYTSNKGWRLYFKYFFIYIQYFKYFFIYIH